MKSKDVTIVIPTLASELSVKALTLCLSSLGETFDGRVLIAINGNESEKEWSFVGMDTIRMEKQGQCHATNEAAKEVTTEWMMVWNDDMIPPPGWFKKFTDVVDNFGLLVASPNLVEPKKGAPPFIEKFCGGVGTVGVDPDFDKQCFLDFVENYKEHENRPIENVVENGWNLPFLIRKDVWDTVGGYDENYDPWGSCSDTDLQAKLMYSGITPKRVRSTLIYHFSNTSGTFHPDNEAYKHENWRYFEKKWGFKSWTNDQGVWYKPEFPQEITFKADWKEKYAS